jgi:hypothetical protein
MALDARSPIGLRQQNRPDLTPPSQANILTGGDR